MLLRTVLSCVVAIAAMQAPPPRVYTDALGRFTFAYPAAFGATSPGTNDGFQDRLAAVRFASFPARFGGEAVLTRGFPLVDLQVAGGLYDALTLEIFPGPLRAQVVAQLPRLTAANFCDALGRTSHLDPNLPAFQAWTPQQRQALAGTDALRNADARVVACRTAGEIVVFDKARAFEAGAPLQHVYGAVRFLPEPYSTFQLVAGGDSPTSGLLGTIDALVRSFSALR